MVIQVQRTLAQLYNKLYCLLALSYDSLGAIGGARTHILGHVTNITADLTLHRLRYDCLEMTF